MQRYLNSLASTATGLPLSGALVTVQYYPQGTGGITTPIASPGVVDWTGHGMIAGQPFVPAGTWPTGVTPGQLYYVLPTGLTANSFQMAATPGGTPINFTVSAGSGQSINAPIYNTNSTGALLANPLTTDINGAFGFYAPDGRYQLTIVPSGGGSSVLQDIELFDSQTGQAPVLIAVGASPFAYTAPGAGMVAIGGGALTSLTLTRNSVVVELSSQTVPVRQGDLITMAYTTVPDSFYFLGN